MNDDRVKLVMEIVAIHPRQPDDTCREYTIGKFVELVDDGRISDKSIDELILAVERASGYTDDAPAGESCGYCIHLSTELIPQLASFPLPVCTDQNLLVNAVTGRCIELEKC